jgi:hypothetical protein
VTFESRRVRDTDSGVIGVLAGDAARPGSERQRRWARGRATGTQCVSVTRLPFAGALAGDEADDQDVPVLAQVNARIT